MSLTTEQAIKLYNSKFWEGMSYREIATFQLHEPRLCMPFSVFHEAMEKTLGRPVFTHEFGLSVERLKAELNGELGAPTFEQILALIPKDKLLLVQIEGDGR